jgi:hypothetical protein
MFVVVILSASAAEVREIELSELKPGVGFTRLGSELTGVKFTNQISDIRAVTNRNLLSGSGVALGDVDGDGWCDIYFCGLDNDNVLYRNLGGWKFEAVTNSMLACPGDDSTGAVFVDVDGDRDLDLLVTGLGSGTRLFVNDGKGRFTERTEEAGLKSKMGSMSMALADIDGDGDLDLYVVNYRPDTLKDIPDAKFKVEYVRGQPLITQLNGVPTTRPEFTNRFVLSPTGEVLEMAQPDQLFINDGAGKFTLASFTDGRFRDENGKKLEAPFLDWGLAASFYDFTGDGAPDLYVCNDLFPPDRIWVNDGNGNFQLIAPTAIRSTSTFSMGVDFADINRDGATDFFVTDMRSRDHVKQQVQVGEMSAFLNPPGAIENRQQKGQNTLQLNRGDGTFAEISWYAGVESSEWSWGPIFMDVDLDGWEDLLISNGNQYDVQNADVAAEVERLKASNRLNHQELLGLLRRFPRLESTKLAFRNEGNLTFTDQSEEWGFGGKEISQGMALGDLDNDGDMDVVINNLFKPAAIFRNEAGAPRIGVRLAGAGRNSGGVGAKVRVINERIEQAQEILSGGRYLSGDQMMRVFAALQGNSRIEVTWRSGKKSVVEKALPNRLYVIVEQRE